MNGRGISALLIFSMILGISLATSVQAETNAPASKPVSAKTQANQSAQNNKQEQYDREVDQVAIFSQEKAISKLGTLVKKYRGTHQEPILLKKLADLQQQNASIYFRLAHGKAEHSGKAIDLSTFRKTMVSSISTLNVLIAKYPNYMEMPQAFFMRGKAYQEIEDKSAAAKDYLYLVNHYPDADEVLPAYMSLGEFSAEANDHERAISYLTKLESHPESPYYPFALYKMAWSYYNLKNIPKALSYTERHITYYDEKLGKMREAGKKMSNTSDVAIRENMLLDSAVFFFEGYEENLAQYKISETLDYFRKLTHNSTELGRLALRYAKLLRSHAHENDLMAWKNDFLTSEPERPEGLDIVLLAYENQQNRNRYPELIKCAQDIVDVYKNHKRFPSFGRAQNMLLETAGALQSLIIKNKGAEGVMQLSATLAVIYDSFMQIVNDSDPRIPEVHHNLAETLFEIKEYEKATTHYRWIVEHRSWDKKAADASLRAIASRYEILREKKLIPTDLKPQSIAGNSEEALDPLLGEWISWIDTYTSKSGPTENFQFEANRSLYIHGHIKQAMDRMTDFVKDIPKSQYAIPTASLVLDTFIAGNAWEDTLKTATSFMEIKEWNKTPFHTRLFTLAAESTYKLIEAKYQEKDYNAALKRSDRFIEKFSSSKRMGDTLMIAGNAALMINDKERANAYYSKLIAEVPGSESIGTAFLARAKMLEERYDFAGAARDYRNFLRLPALQAHVEPSLDEKQLNGLRTKTLMLSWLSGEHDALKETLASKTICTEDFESACDRFTALSRFPGQDQTLADDQVDNAFERARKTTGDNRTIWSALVLENPKELAFRDKLLVLRNVANGWDDLDPVVKFAMIPRLSVSIPETFRMNRGKMGEVAPLRAKEKYITHRVDMIREMENAATKLMKLPWARIRATILSDTAGLYLDMAHELTALPPPKDLADSEKTAYDETIRKAVIPFEEKGQEMSGKAFEIASRYAIEENAFAAVSEPFFRDNPSQAKALKPAFALPKIEALNIAALNEIDPKGDWESPDLESDKPEVYFKARWEKAITTSNWPQVAFFMQEAQEKALLKGGILGAVKAVSFAMAGARGEALEELAEARSSLVPEKRVAASLIMLSHYVNSFSREKSKEVAKALRGTDPEIRLFSTDDEAFLVSYASYWTQVNFPNEQTQNLLKRARKTDNPQWVVWAKTKLEELKPPKTGEKLSERGPN